MKAAVILAILLFAASAVGYVVRGLPANDAARDEREALGQRVSALADVLETFNLVSYAEIDAYETRLSELSVQLDERLLLMLESRSREQPPTLSHVLTRSGPPWLGLDTPMGTRLVQLAAGRPQVDAALARAVEAIAGAGAFDLESVEARNGGEVLPVEAAPDLTAYEAEFVVLCELDQALQILEDLSPHPGEPLLTVAAASLRRVEPVLWPTQPIGLSGPPVRLWVTLTALFRAAPRRGAR
jgi:hypothetical protein